MLQMIENERNIRVFQKGCTPPELQLIQKLDELVELHFKVQKSAAFYCAKLNVTERMLNKTLKFYRNVTIFQLIRQRSVREAETLLLQTNLNVQQVSYKVGVEDPSYFNRMFKELKGISPGKFRYTISD